MRFFYLFNTTTTGLSIAPPAIAPFRWGWDSNPWVPFMLHYLLKPHRQILPMFSLRPTKPPDSLSGFITLTNRSMSFCRKPMLSTSNTMINTGYRTSFRWETRSGYICKKNVLHGPIINFVCFAMGLTPSPRLWVIICLRSTLPPSLNFYQCSMWTSSNHIFHYYWTPQRLKNS
jgi:hypothetical protein